MGSPTYVPLPGGPRLVPPVRADVLAAERVKALEWWPSPADESAMARLGRRRLGRGAAISAMVLTPALIAFVPVVAVLRADPDPGGPTFTVRDTTVSYHLDAPPPGVNVRVSPSTASLLAAAGLDGPALARGTASASPLYARWSPPPGTPTTSSLTQHVVPSCTGVADGNAGDRVQAAYVTQAGGADRYLAVVAALRSYLADVDDVLAVSSAETAGGRRVRWVTDANCVPTILHIVLPAGSLGTAADSDGGFTSTINAMEALGYNARDRKYLMFVEANNLCGIAQVYPTSTKTGNYNNGYAPMFARVDSACWTSTYHSVAAHELMHTLGAVQGDSLHPSAAGHCTDEYDVMCYVDGPGVTMTYPCPAWHEQLYDCNHDDYFSTNPPPGSYLATHWNTADSAFLDTVPDLGASPTLTLDTPATLRPGLGVTAAITGTAPGAASYDWSVTPTACLAGAATAATATVMCPADYNGPVTVSVNRVVAGVAEFGTATIQPTVAGPDPITVTVSAPASVYTETPAALSASLSFAGQPVRATVTWYQAPAVGGTWSRLAGPGPTDATGTSRVSTPALTASERFEVTVTLPATGSTWTAAPRTVTVAALRRSTGVSASATVGTPDRVRGHIFTSSGNLAHFPITLWTHYAGTTVWTAVRTLVTDVNGWTYVWVQPHRYTYYRWTYPGSSRYVPAVSAAVVVPS